MARCRGVPYAQCSYKTNDACTFQHIRAIEIKENVWEGERQWEVGGGGGGGDNSGHRVVLVESGGVGVGGGVGGDNSGHWLVIVEGGGVGGVGGGGWWCRRAGRLS